MTFKEYPLRGADTHIIYLKHPFRNAPDFIVTNVNFDIQDLMDNAEIAYQE